MRKVLVSLAAAATALAFASPVSAQYYPQPQPYGYDGQPYGSGYGSNNYGQVRALQFRIDAVQQQIRQLDRRNLIRDGSADRLRDDARNIEKRLRKASRYGLNGYEMSDIQNRIARLEQRVQFAMVNRNGYSRGGNNYYDHDRYDRDDHHDRNDRDHGRRDRDDD